MCTGGAPCPAMGAMNLTAQKKKKNQVSMLTVCRTFTLTPTTNFPLNRVVLTHRKHYVLRAGKWHRRTDIVQSWT